MGEQGRRVYIKPPRKGAFGPVNKPVKNLWVKIKGIAKNSGIVGIPTLVSVCC